MIWRRSGLTTLRIIEEEGLVERAAELSLRALARLRALKERHPAIGDLRGRGLLLGLELLTDRATKQPANDLAEDVLYRCLDKDLSFKVTKGNVITLTLPLVISEAELDRAFEILDEALGEAG